VSDPPPPPGEDVGVSPVTLGLPIGLTVVIGLGLAALATGLLVLNTDSEEVGKRDTDG
jgi:hypothetical protein